VAAEPGKKASEPEPAKKPGSNRKSRLSAEQAVLLAQLAAAGLGATEPAIKLLEMLLHR
jgi:hypothetical protein